MMAVFEMQHFDAFDAQFSTVVRPTLRLRIYIVRSDYNVVLLIE